MIKVKKILSILCSLFIVFSSFGTILVSAGKGAKNSVTSSTSVITTLSDKNLEGTENNVNPASNTTSCSDVFNLKKPRVYYWNGAKNFGDQLNRDILNYFKIDYVLTNAYDCDYVFIGSILDHVRHNSKINIFGAGFAQSVYGDCRFSQDTNVYCLRGKKSKSFLEKVIGKNLNNCLLGDPGLLCRYIFPESEQKKYDVGIVCHLADKNSAYLKNIRLKGKSHTFIDVCQETKDVCKKLNQCKFILSSAMHALIVCDSYGIPNRRIILTDSESCWNTRCNFKFDDYYSIYDKITVPSPIDLKYNVITDSDIDNFISEYTIPTDVISNFCDKYHELIKNHFLIEKSDSSTPGFRLKNLKIKTQKTVDDGIYIISSKLDPNKCLDINGCSKDDKANLQLWQKNGTNAQKFKIQYHSDGYYSIKAICSEKFIDVLASGKKNGTNIWQYSGNGTDAQKWFIVPDGDGYYCLVSKCNNMCMDDSSVKAKNGANIHCWDIHGGDNQKFKFEKCEDKLSKAKKNAVKPSSNKSDEVKKETIKSSEDKPGEVKKSA